MYLGVDIGGTKTLVACLTSEGVVKEQIRFLTPKLYSNFLKELELTVDKFSTRDFRAAGVGVPGLLDRDHGRVSAFGNLPWKNVPLQTDVEKIVHCPVTIENDAKLAALSEALLIKKYERALYITISTGIGTGVVQNGMLDPALINAESGSILLEHNGKLTPWEKFASGKAIVEQFGKKASEIYDAATWKVIAHNLAVGIVQLIAIIQPDVIVFGGAVSEYFDRFEPYLSKELRKYETPLTPTPAIMQAKRPEEAVIYGCYDLVKAKYGHPA